MMGDDWLNNAMTQETYGRYVENQLEDEIRTHTRRLQKLAAKRRIRYRPDMVLGKPTDCLIRTRPECWHEPGGDGLAPATGRNPACARAWIPKNWCACACPFDCSILNDHRIAIQPERGQSLGHHSDHATPVRLSGVLP